MVSYRMVPVRSPIQSLIEDKILTESNDISLKTLTA